jgi:hypothetical protein
LSASDEREAGSGPASECNSWGTRSLAGGYAPGGSPIELLQAHAGALRELASLIPLAQAVKLDVIRAELLALYTECCTLELERLNDRALASIPGGDL